MADNYTLARPYADAVFELAEVADGGFAAWSDALAALTAIVSNETVAALMSNPRVADAALADAIIDIAADDLHEGARNLVRLLIDNDRLALAPQIAALYEEKRATAEKRLNVEVISAVDMSEEQRKALGAALKKWLKRDVTMTFKQNDSVIGGAIVRAGDLVIDGSLAAQLRRMRESVAR